MAARWHPYPWSALERLPPGTLGLMRLALASLPPALSLQSLAEQTSALVHEPVQLWLGRRHPSTSRRAAWPQAAQCLLVSADGQFALLLELEPSLAARLVAKVLLRPVPLVDSTSAVPTEVQAALGALVAVVLRRAGMRPPLVLSALGHTAFDRFFELAQSPFLRLDLTALIADEAFAFRASYFCQPAPSAGLAPFNLQALRSLGSIPLALPLVGALSTTTAAAWSALEPGDAWMPASGWWATSGPEGLSGTLALCAAWGTLGIEAKLSPPGQIVLGERLMPVEADTQALSPSSVPTEQAESLSQVLGDVPLVVRVELGQVVLSAQQWAALRPGDVLTTGRRIAERVTLRIAGQEVAHGELVEVDGELGVCIHDLVQQNGGAE